MFSTNKIDPHARAVSFFEDWSDRLRFGNEDADEAIQNSIQWVFRNDADLNHLDQADLYATIVSKLEANKAPELVLVIVEEAIRAWANI